MNSGIYCFAMYSILVCKYCLLLFLTTVQISLNFRVLTSSTLVSQVSTHKETTESIDMSFLQLRSFCLNMPSSYLSVHSTTLKHRIVESGRAGSSHIKEEKDRSNEGKNTQHLFINRDKIHVLNTTTIHIATIFPKARDPYTNIPLLASRIDVWQQIVGHLYSQAKKGLSLV